MDLYIVLGVHREATPGDIKKAYRRLARRWHPDINPGDHEAVARFRQVLEAYETLIDPDRRRRYDLGQITAAPDPTQAFGFAGFDFSSRVHAEKTTTFGELFEEIFARRRAQPRPAVERGADIHAQATLSFDEAWHGAQRQVLVTRQQACRVCAGSGFRRTVESHCVACEGTGTVRSVRGHMVFAKNCPRCAGSGRLRQETCAACPGQGVQAVAETLAVRVPAGIADGARVRVAGKGHAGVRGGPPGDLFIEVRVEAHERYHRDGDDLHMQVPIAIHEAGLGTRLELATPDGPTRLRVPPGTQTGQRFRLRGRGAVTRGGARGDLVVEVRIALPRVLDERSKELLREFGRINGEGVREG